MKSILIILFAILLGSSIQAQEKKKTEELKIKTSAVCDMCKYSLEKTMAYEKGVKASSLDVPSKVITVTYNPKKTSPEKLKKAICLTGYDADEMPADSVAYEKLHACCKKDVKH